MVTCWNLNLHKCIVRCVAGIVLGNQKSLASNHLALYKVNVITFPKQAQKIFVLLFI